MSHLRDVNLSWARHLRFAWELSWKLFLLSLTALVHGIFPSTFQASVSDKINRLSDEFRRDTLSRNPH